MRDLLSVACFICCCCCVMDSVCFIDISADTLAWWIEGKDPIILTNESQRDVRVLEWRPNGGRMLAVGCKWGSVFCAWLLWCVQCQLLGQCALLFTRLGFTAAGAEFVYGLLHIPGMQHLLDQALFPLWEVYLGAREFGISWSIFFGVKAMSMLAPFHGVQMEDILINVKESFLFCHIHSFPKNEYYRSYSFF